METTEHIRSLLQEGKWLASLDLHDVYFHVPIHNKHRKYLRFVSAGKFYQFTVLPTGLSSSGRVFSRVIKEVKQFVHPLGINLHQYLYDWQNFHTTELHTQFILKLTTHLGFLVNFHKSEIRPNQDIIFLGRSPTSIRRALEQDITYNSSIPSSFSSSCPDLATSNRFAGLD